MTTEPIFIIGTERSGTNLLRLMLDSHPAIVIPHPPHIMKEMGPLVKYYGDLSADRNFMRLARDVVKFVQLHFHPWETRPDPAMIFETAIDRSLYGIMVALYEQYRKSQGKKRWGCKSTFMIHHVDTIRKHHKPKLIHLVRDPRDVAASAKESVFSRYHPYYVSRLWSAEQKEAIRLLSTLPADEIISVRYEDLLEDPEQALKRICDFIGEPFEKGMIDYFLRDRSVKTAGLSRSWENLRLPVMKQNVKQYARKLSQEEIEIVERNTREEMTYFGYTPDNLEGAPAYPAVPPFPIQRRIGFFLSDASSVARVELRALFTDRNAVPRFRRRIFLCYLRARLALGALFRFALSRFRAFLASG